MDFHFLLQRIFLTQGLNLYLLRLLHRRWKGFFATEPPGKPPVGFLGWEDFPREGNGYPLQYSNLENSMDYIVHVVSKSQTGLSDFHFICFFSTIRGRYSERSSPYPDPGTATWAQGTKLAICKPGRRLLTELALAGTLTSESPGASEASELSEDKFLLFKPQSMVLRQPVLR